MDQWMNEWMNESEALVEWVTWKNQSTLIKTHFNATLSTINPTWSSLGLNPGLYDNRSVTHRPSHFMTWKQCKSSYMPCQRRRHYSSGDVAPIIVNLGTRRTWAGHFIQPLHYSWWKGCQYQQTWKMRPGKCNDILNIVDRIKYPAHTRNWVPVIQSWAIHYTQQAVAVIVSLSKVDLLNR